MAKLLWIDRRLYYPLAENPLTIGRSADCNIQVQDSRASRRHCEISQDQEGYYIKDLNSYNGTFCNNAKVANQARLKIGDQIQAGNSLFMVVDDQAMSNPLECEPTSVIRNKEQAQISTVGYVSSDQMIDSGKSTLPNIIPLGINTLNTTTHPSILTGPAADALALLQTCPSLTPATSLGIKKMQTPDSPHANIKKSDIVASNTPPNLQSLSDNTTIPQMQNSEPAPERTLQSPHKQIESSQNTSPTDLPKPTHSKKRPQFLIGQQRVVQLIQSKYSIGRRETNTICIKDNQISANHAELILEADGWWIVEVKSRNGIWVNGRNVTRHKLESGDRILIGETNCIFYTDSPPTSTTGISLSWIIAIVVLLLSAITTAIIAILSYSTPTNMTMIPDNLLKDFSFEEGLNWEYSSGFEIQKGISHSGKAALVGALTTGAQANYTDLLPIYKKCYNFSFWTYCQEWQGWTGMKITWLQKDKKIGETYSPLTRGTKDWSQVQWIALPPPSADHFQVSLLAFGTGKAVYFDDIVALEESNNFIEDATQQHAECRWHLNSIGLLQLENNLETVQVGSWEIQTLDGTQSLATPKISNFIRTQYQTDIETKKKFRVSQWEQAEGMCYSHETTKPVHAIVEVNTQNQEWLLQYKIEATTSEEVMAIYTLTLPKNFLVQRIVKPTTNTQSELVWYFPQSKKRWTLIFPHTLNWQIMPDGTDVCFTAQYPIQSQSGLWSWNLRLQVADLADTKQLKQWLDEAQTYQQNNNLSKATQLYRKILNQGLLPPEFANVAQLAGQLEERYQQDLATLLQFWNQARFFNTLPAYQFALERSKTVIKPWQEPIQETIIMQEMLAQFQTELDRLKELEQNRSLAKLADTAKKWQNEKSWAVAQVLYQDIIATYPNSPEATQAKLELQKISQQK